MALGLKDRFSIVKGLLYLTLGICCVYLIVTGRYLNYIAPRYELLLGISSVALILGPMLDIKNVYILKQYMPTAFIVRLSITIAVMSYLAALVYQFLLS